MEIHVVSDGGRLEGYRQSKCGIEEVTSRRIRGSGNRGEAYLQGYS